MAIELNGKPLKFTAEFDSKQAEQSIEQFMSKLKNINSKGLASGNAYTVTSKASGQYQSLLYGATKAFDVFSSSSKNFYTQIAQGEMQLQKIRNEQNLLNKDLRQGLVTEDEYIRKTSQLNNQREEFSRQIKANKSDLQKLSAVQNSKPKFTREDTTRELAGAHRTGMSGVQLSTTDAFAKATQDSLNKLNAELTELDRKLKQGSITNEQYAKSAAVINNKIKEATLNQEHFNLNIGKKTGSTQELEKQKTILDAVSAEYKGMVEDATSAFTAISPEAQRLNNSLVSLRQESKNLNNAQKELDAAYKNGDITQRQYLEGTRNLGIQQNSVRQRINETNKAINQLDASERRSIGSIAEMTARLTQLQQRYIQLSEAQRQNINVGGRIRQEYQKISAEVQKLNNELSGTKSGGISSALGSIRGIAGAMGITFSAQQLFAFGQELFNIAKQAEGIELRFAKIGDTSGLEKLSKATKNTVSDLELMKLAVNADNFRIPMDVLAKGLEFATRRASETGQSVDYLVNSFVTGLGRKSKLILDNLGISVIELNEEINRTGDFATAVGNIIQREMDKSGEAVDGLTEKTNRLSTQWENFKKNIAQGFASFMYPGSPDSKNIEKLTETYKKNFDTIKGYSDDSKKVFIQNSQEQLNEVNKRLKSLDINSPEFKKMYQDSKSARSVFDYKTPEDYLSIVKKPLVEQQQALQASLAYAKGVTKEMEIQSRQAKGVFSMVEVEQKLEDANLFYKNAIGDAQRTEAKKEVDKWQKLYDEMNLKASKKRKTSNDKLLREIDRDNNERMRLLNQWAKADADYDSKQLTRDEQEIESVRAKYAEIEKAIDEYNKKTKSKQIDSSTLSDSRNKAISSVEYLQETERLKSSLSDQLDLYEQFENAKEQIGEEKAKARFSKEIDVARTYMQVLEAEMGKLLDIDPSNITEVQKRRLEELTKMQAVEEKKQREGMLNRFVDAINLSKTQSDKIKEIDNKYQLAFQQLEENKTSITEKEYAQRNAIVRKGLEEEKLESNRTFVEANTDFKKKMMFIEEAGAFVLPHALRLGREALKNILDGMELSPAQRKELENLLDEPLRKASVEADLELYDNVANALQGFDQLIESASQFEGALGKSLKTISGMVVQAGQLSRTIGDALKGEKGFEGLSKILSNVGGLSPIIGTVVSAYSSLTSLFDKARERRNQENQKQIEKQNELQLKSTEAITKLLERQLELINDIYGVARIEKYASSLNEIVKNYAEINKQLSGRYLMTSDDFTNDILRRLNNGETSKEIQKSFKTASVEGVKAYEVLKNLSRYTKIDSISDFTKDISKAREELQALQLQADLGKTDDFTKNLIEQLQNQIDLYVKTTNKLREETTGTGFQSLLGDVKNLFLNSGEDAAEAWSKGFDKIMDNYLMQRFSREYLEESLQVWYEAFDVMAKDGITSDEKDALKQAWDKINKDGQERLNAIKDAIGYDASKNENTNSLSGAYARASQESIDLLAGQTGAMRIHLSELVNQSKAQQSILSQQIYFANESLNQAILIERNTRITAEKTTEYLPYLKGIEANTKGNLDMQLRAAGKFGF